MKFLLLILLFTSVCFTEANAQRRKLKQMDPDKQEQEDKAKAYEQSSWKEKISFGGNAWAYFGRRSGNVSGSYSFVLLQPMAFYRFTDNTIAGAGVTYIYMNQTYEFPNSTKPLEISDNAFGFNFLGRQTIAGPIFAQAEYMPMNFTSYNQLGEKKRVWGQSLYLGGGLHQDLGGFNMYIAFLYDVLWKEYDTTDPRKFNTSFYPTPFDIRMGFMF